MQFPVPQFTEVEDKIIGPLTVKQFGIIFGAGVIIFLGYSATKSLGALIVLGILVGLPAAGVAFAKINGRPLYVMFGFVLKFILSPKILVFHKQGVKASVFQEKKPAAETKSAAEAEAPQSPRQRLREVNRLLAEKAREEEELLKRMK